MSEKQNLGFLRQVESMIENHKAGAVLTIVVLGLLLAACTPRVWATHEQSQIDILMTILSDGKMRLDPELMRNTVLGVTGPDGMQANLSDNMQGIPGTYTYVDIELRNLQKLKFASYIYVKGEGIGKGKNCSVVSNELGIFPGGYNVSLVCP